MESETFVLTLERVKECIAFEPGTPIHDTLNRLCDVWYAMKKKEGAPDSDAAMYTMDRLGETLLSWGKEKNEQVP